MVAENVLAFIDHIDVMGNNGSLVLERIDFDHQFLAFAEHDPDSYIMQDFAVLFKVVLLVQLLGSCLWITYNLHSNFP